MPTPEGLEGQTLQKTEVFAGYPTDSTFEMELGENKDPGNTSGSDDMKMSNIEQYKPASTFKTHLYTMNELLEISKSVNGASPLSVGVNLPKKSFWRLTSRHPDIRQSESTATNGSGNKSNSSFKSQDFNGEKKNQRTKNTKSTRRGSKFAKGDKQYVEEKDIKVNNDELLALEEEIKPTGNSITDFENWRSKMKELERKKKGQTSNGHTEGAERPSLHNNGSSLSDFFNLKRESSSTFEELEPQDTSETSKGSYSRFSSFFNSGSAPDINEAALAQPPTPKEAETRPAAGSRILSFFDNMESRKTAPEQAPQQNTPVQHVQVPPVQEQTNSHFFQDLLNKGKLPSASHVSERRVASDNSAAANSPVLQTAAPNSTIGTDQLKARESQTNRGPPGLSKIPNTKPVMSPTAQPGFPMGVPMNLYHQNAQPMSRPPAGYQHFQMPPPGVAMPQPYFGNQRQAGDFSATEQKEESGSRPPNVQLPFIPGPHNMPPPGFPPMHGMPPGISQDMPITMNNMIPFPPGFFPPHGPSLPQFGNQPIPPAALNGQPQRQGMPPRKSK
ncbi:LANO_0F15610g1_1 [Lachancea nothofagi CBS 11611]|uniref:LANO_0F15610g1_1 n=1 Tax=Lachancea nothofagi CBS 11611 TaxID=1266666 RepID=A0A1G4KCR5_9SACH|nr:LANO_0F15610g1_1 [Lachancea nothofagi CBS 11611]